MTSFWTISCFAGGTGALLLAVLLIWRNRKGYVLGALTSVLVTIAWIQFANGLALWYGDRPILWPQIALLGEIALPVALCHVGFSLVKHLSADVEQKRLWRLRAILFLALGIGILVLGFPHLIINQIPETGEIVYTGAAGRVVWSFILLSLVLALSELEQILRISRDPLRYQLKFILIGLGGIAGFAIAQSSQLLLLSLWKQEYAWAGSVVALICVGLIAVGLGRWRMQGLSQKLYLSHQALYTSFTFFIVGCYLIGIGVLAEVLQRTGWAWSEALKLLLLFIGILALILVLFSRQARAEVRVFISRHFYRSKYDYRAKWLEVTEAFSECHSSKSILDQFLNILSRTFGAAQITIWIKFEADSHFHQVRSVNPSIPPQPLQQTHPIVINLEKQREPMQLGEQADQGNEEAQRFCQATKAVACVPLQTYSGQLMGFVTLSEELQGRSYGKDDFDLLRAMAHHVTMLLTHSELMEDQTAAAEWEALHRFSAFYLHDLKNLASGLSLVVQNAELYGQDPDFQASAWRTIGKTTQRMMVLMNRLSTQSKITGETPPQSIQLVDINDLIHETVESLNGTYSKPKVFPGTDLPLVHIMPEAFKQVLLNVMLNACQAVKNQGTVEVRTDWKGGWVVVSVTDTGDGIPSSQLRSIFKPFRTTKKGGLGVGLYQCKQIIDQHQGLIHVNSEVGHGTEILISLPVRNEKS